MKMKYIVSDLRMKVKHKDGTNNQIFVNIYLYLYDLLNTAPTKLWFLGDNYIYYEANKSIKAFLFPE